MRATQAAMGNLLPADVLAEIDAYRRPRRRRDWKDHTRQAIYLAQKWVITLRRKSVVVGRPVNWLPWPEASDFHDGRWVYEPHVQQLYDMYGIHWRLSRGINAR
jgi:hypothetical protein